MERNMKTPETGGFAPFKEKAFMKKGAKDTVLFIDCPIGCFGDWEHCLCRNGADERVERDKERARISSEK